MEKKLALLQQMERHPDTWFRETALPGFHHNK